MNLSYWEYQTWFSDTDFIVVGSGIVGLSCALHLRARFPDAKILILEKGILPQGASTKNAGFACFGSISEILSDLQKQPEEEVVNLVRRRWDGIGLLRDRIGDAAMDFQCNGGHEIFLADQAELSERCLSEIDSVNRLLKPVFGENPFRKQPNRFRFKNVRNFYITQVLEGQLDTGKMMHCLLEHARRAGILILNGIGVDAFEDYGTGVLIKTTHGEFSTHNLLVATNGFAAELLNEEVSPARAQVLVTKPIPGLEPKGTFHLDRGYYYFRNIGNRLLLGGGRNLDIAGETTTTFGQTALIQGRLEQLLEEVILPGKQFEIDLRWSGIMGVGSRKDPIVRQLSERVFCGVRLGGMGIAIGSLVGKELAALVP